MKKLLLLCCLTVIIGMNKTEAQCGSGYNKCSINWDYLNFFPSAGLSSYTNLARSQTQYFAFGIQRISVTHNFTGSNALGEDATNTGDAGSYGVGEDVHFIGDGAIGFSFQSTVDSVRFSIYDIDYNQKVSINSNAGSVITITNLSGTALLAPVGIGTSSASITAQATTVVADASTDGTINVLIVGSVNSFTVTTSQTGTKITGPAAGREDGSFWLSDISACSPGTFSSNFFQASKPYNNQPGYVITVRNNNVYYVDPATGKAKFMFTDPGHTNINSMAYDPVKHYLYYVYSLTGPSGTIDASNKTLRRYDYNVDTFGILLNDITSLIPTFDVGVESGAAAFYDGSLYLGVEASSSSTYKSIIWKVDFNAADVPVGASQVYGIAGANHDWADIGVVNGMLYDFDGSASAPDYYHINLYTHAVTNFAPAGSLVPKQLSIDWNNNVYEVGQPTSGTTGQITPYQYNGTLNIPQQKVITYNGVSVTGSWGDGAEAFKPKLDFGDAPASFDPVTGDPAVHEISSTLLLGTTADNEWTSRGQTIFANSDNYDDAIIGGSLINSGTGNYFVQIKYLNNTGSTATICAWVDFNNNGVYDTGEGLSQTGLPSSASSQTTLFNWTGVTTSLVNGSYTYLRLRISYTANGMTTTNPTGYFGDGEVEDYRIAVTTNPLSTQLIKFTVNKIAERKLNVDWQVTNEEANTIYTLQRSSNAQSWTDINSQKAITKTALNNYTYVDAPLSEGVLYYRLKITAATTFYSDVRKIDHQPAIRLQLLPNPASENAWLLINADASGFAQISLYDVSGRIINSQNTLVNAGTTQLRLPLQSTLANGVYWLQVLVGNHRYTEKLVINK